MTRGTTTAPRPRARRAWLMLPLAICVWAPVAVPQTDAAAKPLPPEQQRLARVRDDLAAAAAALAKADHSFTGECTYASPADADDRPIAVPFRGAVTGDVDQLWCQDFHVLRHGERELVRKGATPFGLPQGDSPDCPLWPRQFATVLAGATVRALLATAHQDRPAMVAHLVWTKQGAAALCELASFPASKPHALLESFSGRHQRREDGLMLTDAMVTYDPATKRLLAVQLRLAVLPSALPAGTERATKDALPGLDESPVIEFTFRLVIDHGQNVALPPLTDVERSQLGLAPK